jgi:hypothetical protein
MNTRFISVLVFAGLALFTTAIAKPAQLGNATNTFALAEAHAAGEAGFGEFLATCPFSHRAADDPIVLPNQPGASHMHDFFGNITTNASSTLGSLLAGGTNCNPVSDRSAYWVPTLYDAKSQPVGYEHITLYYFVNVTPASSVQPYPQGLRIIAGDAMATAPPVGPARFRWSCLGAPNSSSSDFVICPAGSRLELLLNYPDCWDGINLDSIDHKRHMAYSAGGTCPTTHPVAVPQLQFKLRYATPGEAGMRLSTMSGAAYTAHGDFFNAWEQKAMENRINCLRQLIKCTEVGFPGLPDPAPMPTTPAPANPNLRPRAFVPVVEK